MLMPRGVQQLSASQHNKSEPVVAVYEYNEDASRPAADRSFSRTAYNSQQQQQQYSDPRDLSQRQESHYNGGMSGFNPVQESPPTIYVRALYDYDADDQTSLSFRKGDVIQVLTQLESGWWDGVINDVRGWFPSNYCAIVSGPDDLGEEIPHGHEGEASAESGTEDEFEGHDEELDSDHDENTALPLEGTTGNEQEEAAFWIPQATPDGRLFYFNIMTGVSTMELPLETTSLRNESGPYDRTNFNIPDQTRPPPELMARGYERDEDQYDGSASEAENESMTATSRGSLPQTRRSNLSDGMSPATSIDSMNASPVVKTRNGSKDFYSNNNNGSMSATQRSMPPLGTSATSFASSPNVGSNSGGPRYFLDDGTTIPMTWTRLVENMRVATEAYKLAINNGDRAEFVKRAEDISDHLRMLLAAGSGTTDNHSGNPSIISTNKALYPHFREMMSKFSKLVLSSHIAAADWPGPDSHSKCLQEADGVLNSIYGYVDVARQQRGEEIPRLVPGFLHGSLSGGHWQNNNIESRDPTINTSFMDNDDYDRPEPSLPLDSHLINDVDEARRPLIMAIKRIQEQLYAPDKIITTTSQIMMAESICEAAGKILDLFRPWIHLVESTDLSVLGSTFETPLLVDFSSHKQRAYDCIAELITSCQALGAPLSDEWAELHGESLEDRLGMVQTAAKHLDSVITEVSFSLQLLMSAIPSSIPSASKSEHRITDGGETFAKTHLRVDSLVPRPQLGDIGHSNSYTIGVDAPPEKFRRIPNSDKARRFFGQMPPPNVVKGEGNDPSDETPWFLKLDHENEVGYDSKLEPPQLKSGTLVGLVEQLTRHDKLDAAFNSTFLLTYRSFTTASELFGLLVKRFSIQPPPGLAPVDLATWEEKKQKPIRFRVVNVLKTWFENYWMEGNDDASMALLHSVYQFAKGSIASTKTPGAAPLMTVVEQRLKGQDTTAKKLVLTLTNSAPPSITPKNMKKLKFLDIDALEFARQLTIIESKLYGKIKPTECLNKTWSKKSGPDEPDLAPNVKALILHSNQLTNWVAEMILAQSDVRRRVIVIKHFVAIADKCRYLNNYSGLTAIISAFGTAPILRLKRTWDQLNQKTGAVLESMRKLMSNTKNFSEYREKLHLANPPCIPFFGVYLTDLTFIEDGIASVVKNTNLINFTKRTKTAEVIRDIQQYQNVPYALTAVAELQDYILEHMKAAGDVHEMYDRSLQVEPREREDEKITRLLSESGFL